MGLMNRDMHCLTAELGAELLSLMKFLSLHHKNL